MKCKRCRCVLEYIGRGRPRKYCEECAYIVNLNRERMRIFRKRNLGTSDFFGHKKKNNDRESVEVKKEIKRLNIKRQFT